MAGDQIRTRFVADLSGPVGFTAYVLPDPYRVVIDLPAVTFDLPDAAATPRPHQGLPLWPGGRGPPRIVLDTGPGADREILPARTRAGPARPHRRRPRSDQRRGIREALKADEPAALAAVGGNEIVTEETERQSPARAPAARGRPWPAATRPHPARGRRSVVIDPGHGGIDPGAIGLRKTKEKDVVLAFGLDLKKVLEGRAASTS